MENFSYLILFVVFLGLGDLHYHFGCGMLYIHSLQDGHTVIGNDYITQIIHEHLVHAPRTQSGPDDFRYSLSCQNVYPLGTPSHHTGCALRQY